MTSRHERGRQLFIKSIELDVHPRNPVRVWRAEDYDGDDVLYVPGHLVIDDARLVDELGATPCDCPDFQGHDGIYHADDEEGGGNVHGLLAGLQDAEWAVISPIYGLMSCQAVMPTDDPELAPRLPAPPPAASSLGEGITIAVIDTGEALGGGVQAVIARMDAMQGVAAGGPAMQEFQAANRDLDELIDPRTLRGGPLAAGGERLAWAAGHGQFVANLITQVAPGVSIRHFGACSPMGFEREIEVAAAINRAVNEHVDIINLSWCAFPLLHPQNAQGLPRHPPILVRRAIERAQNEENRIAVVAAAGNAGSQDLTYPAAFDGVLSVGGLDRSGQRAFWSNYGDWVRVWAPSEHLWAEYVAGQELPENDPDQHVETWADGDWASWSGTSFATALVSGQLAVLMAATGQRGAAAIRSLEAMGYPVPELFGRGRRLSVYLPYQYLP
jgi:subtilisin family serine protease